MLKEPTLLQPLGYTSLTWVRKSFWWKPPLPYQHAWHGPPPDYVEMPATLLTCGLMVLADDLDAAFRATECALHQCLDLLPDAEYLALETGSISLLTGLVSLCVGQIDLLRDSGQGQKLVEALRSLDLPDVELKVHTGHHGFVRVALTERERCMLRERLLPIGGGLRLSVFQEARDRVLSFSSACCAEPPLA